MNFISLINQFQVTHDTFFTSAAKAVNIRMTIRNWLFGYYIVEYEQNGEDRARYGSRLLKELSNMIPIKGISETNLKIFRQFYLTYPAISQTVSDELHVFDVETIQCTSKAIIADNKTGLPPSRLLQTLSFSHFVELIKNYD